MKVAICLVAVTSLVGCKALFEDDYKKKPPVEDYRSGNYQGDYRNGDYRNGYNDGYNNGDYRNGNTTDYRSGSGGYNNGDYRSGNGGYNNGDYHSGNGNRGNYPAMGSTVTSLGVRNPQKVVVHGETLYVVNGVYYKAVRSASGTVYQVVGYQQN